MSLLRPALLDLCFSLQNKPLLTAHGATSSGNPTLSVPFPGSHSSAPLGINLVRGPGWWCQMCVSVSCLPELRHISRETTPHLVGCSTKGNSRVFP